MKLRAVHPDGSRLVVVLAVTPKLQSKGVKSGECSFCSEFGETLSDFLDFGGATKLFESV
eukprot:4188811-Amphidinium_carterae.1